MGFYSDLYMMEVLGIESHRFENLCDDFRKILKQEGHFTTLSAWNRKRFRLFSFWTALLNTLYRLPWLLIKFKAFHVMLVI